MIKKFVYILFVTLFFFLFNQTKVRAIEYCHIHENDILIETIELPFYFYENILTTQEVNSWIETNYTSTYTLIDSRTKCESINKKVIQNFTPLPMTLKVYDYSQSIYKNYTNKQLYENSKLKKASSIIRGYSSIEDKEPPYFKGYNEFYKTNIDYPLSLEEILKNISAYDDRDGNITNNIIIEYSEYEDNLNKIGNYPIILSVEDSSFNKASITFYIEIIDTTSPIIEGTQNYISLQSFPLTIEEIKKELIAHDNTNEDLTSQIYVCDDTFSSNKNKPGIYSIYFCVCDDSSNQSSPYKTTIEVQDDIIPIIEGLDYFTSYLSNPLSIQEILYYLAASDNHKDIFSNIFITNDYYSNNLNTLGEKNIIFQVMDEANNISEPFKVTIDLKDDVKPQIFGLGTYTSYLSNALSITHLKQQLTVLDNFDGNISNTLEIIDDTYSPNINKIGTYYITFKAIDYSQNESEIFKINITSIDDVSPSIIGPSSLKYSLTNKPALNNILSEFKSSDNINENLEITIENDTYSDSLTTGTYYITLSCTDDSENKSIPFTVKIEIVDILLNLNEISISLPTNKLYTIEEINKIINLNEQYSIKSDTYTENFSKEGIYTIEFELKDSSIIILKINTYTPTNKEEPTKKQEQTEKKETFFNKIKSFFINLFNKIKLFFKNIFNLYIYLNYQQ